MNNKKQIRVIIFVISVYIFTANLKAQNNLEYYLDAAKINSPILKENSNLLKISELNKSLNQSQNVQPQIALTSNYLFAPYFNNKGKIVSSNPEPNAIGYDAGITNGGLYSVLINFEKNLFNEKNTRALENQSNIQLAQYKYNYELEKRNLQKQVTDQYLSAYKSLLLYSLSKETSQNVELQLEHLGELVEKGYAQSQSYLLLKIELQTENIDLKDNLQQYKKDLLQLNSICGINEMQIVFIDSLRLTISGNNSDYRLLEKFKLDSMASTNQQELLETKYSPKVKFFMNTGINAVELDGIQRKFGMSAGIDFQLPIYDGGQKDITHQQNEIAINSIRDYQQYASVNIEIQKQCAISNIRQIQNNLSEINIQLKDYKELIKLSKSQLSAGNISMIEYLTILRNLTLLKKTKIINEINLQTEINNYNYWNW